MYCRMLSHIPGLYLLYVNHSQLWQSTMSPDIARCCLGNKLNCSSELMLINVQTHRPASFPKLHFSFFFFPSASLLLLHKKKKIKISLATQSNKPHQQGHAFFCKDSNWIVSAFQVEVQLGVEVTKYLLLPLQSVPQKTTGRQGNTFVSCYN